MFYTRAQLKLLLALAATLLIGLGVREWRAGFPELADRLERFDREDPGTPLLAAPRAERRAPLPPTNEPAALRSAEPPREAAKAEPPAAAPADARPLDINRASVDELARLPGVGRRLAARILAERERRGRFESPETLREVLGMGPKKLAAIRELITASE